MKEKITQIIKDVSDQHPYKKVGDPDSYSEYNEGWSDVCDVIEQRLIEEIVHPDPEPECQFESDTLTSSATICKHCGKEKHEHSYVSKLCPDRFCHFTPLTSQSSEKPNEECDHDFSDPFYNQGGQLMGYFCTKCGETD
jgi:hypothetical protein